MFWFSPFNKVSSNTIEWSKFTSNRFKKISIYFGIISAFATIFYGFHFIKFMSVVDIINARDDILDNGSTLPPNVITLIFSLVAPLYFINLILFFISIKEKWKKYQRFVFILGSFSYPLQVLCSFGRDGVLYWVINFFILYLLFRNLFNSITRKKILRFSIIITIISGSTFYIITEARFGSNAKYQYNFSPGESLFLYMGAQPRNFSDCFTADLRMEGGLFNGTENIIRKRVFGEVKKAEIESYIFKNGKKFELNIFGFYTKELILFYGKAFAVLVSIFFYLISLPIRRRFTRNRYLIDFIMLYLLFQVPMNGVFYYRQYIGSQDLSYLIIFILYITHYLFLSKYTSNRYNMRNGI